MCMKTYDYKDEQKDVKGKVSDAQTKLTAATSRSIDQNNGFFIFAVELGLTFPDLRYV